MVVSSVFWGLNSQAQQNIQLTQYIFNSLSVNPAYAGYKEDWFIQTGLRSQWVSLSGAPQTGVLSMDGLLDPLAGRRHGVGIQFMADKLGPQTASSAYLNYAYRLRLDQYDTQRISFGLGVGVTQYSLDGTMLTTQNPNDIIVPSNRIANFIPDLRFGMYYYNPRWYAGISVMDLLSGDQSNNIFRWDNTTTDNIRRRRHFYFIGGALVALNDGLKLRPSVLVKEDFVGPTSLDVNAMLVFGDRLWLGGGWRTGITVFERDYTQVTGNPLHRRNSFSIITQIYLTQQFRVGYSYDHIVSRLASVQNGSHEVTLGITFGAPYNCLLSPRFF